MLPVYAIKTYCFRGLLWYMKTLQPLINMNDILVCKLSEKGSIPVWRLTAISRQVPNTVWLPLLTTFPVVPYNICHTSDKSVYHSYPHKGQKKLTCCKNSKLWGFLGEWLEDYANRYKWEIFGDHLASIVNQLNLRSSCAQTFTCLDTHTKSLHYCSN